MMRTAIIGIGSIGTIVGALVFKNKPQSMDVVLVDANKAHVAALREHGATVTGKMDLKNIPVEVILPSELEGLYDNVILLTKQTYNKSVFEQLLPHLHKDSVVCTLQNGIPEESVANYAGADRTVGGTIGWGATWKGPGVSELTSDPERMIFEIGECDGSLTPRLESIAQVLRQGCVCHIIRNLTGIRWSKLLMNSTMSGLSAALGCTYGDILDDENAICCAAHLTNELIAVADARDIHLEVLVEGFNFYDLRFSNLGERDDAVAWLRKFYIPDRPLKASMMQDMEKGIPCEIRQINGVVSAWGKKVGVATPMNDAIVRIVTEFEVGKRPFPTMANLEDFELPDSFGV